MQSERAYTTNAPTKKKSNSSNSDKQTLHNAFCDKDGHTASKCWNEPPFYCPKCKTQGHTLRECADKGKKKTNAGGKPFKGKGKQVKQKQKSEEEEEAGEHSMMMLTPTVTKDGTMVDCALHA